jgi:hypothetical protein
MIFTSIVEISFTLHLRASLVPIRVAESFFANEAPGIFGRSSALRSGEVDDQRPDPQAPVLIRGAALMRAQAAR